MIHRLVVTPTAEAELLDAAQWYQDQQADLEVAFLMELQTAFDAAQHRPTSFPKTSSVLRRVRLNRFPYAVYFRMESRTVRVVAVRHTARRNADLQD